MPGWWGFTIGRLFGRGSPSDGESTQDGFYANPVRLNPQAIDPQNDQIRAVSIPQPYSQPGDPDNYGQESDEMRTAYRKFHRAEPAVKSAIEGVVNCVADLDVSVMPDDEDNKDDQRAAEFLQWTVERSLDGWDGLIKKVLTPGLVDGWSATEPVFHPTTEGRKFGGLWGYRRGANKDTDNLRLRLDAYHNVIGIVNAVRGLATYPVEKVILFTHADMYNNPFGSSELRAAYRACQLIDDCYQLWHYALNVYGGPFLIGKVKNRENRLPFQEVLKAARAGGFIVCSDQDAVEIVNLASATSFSAFKEKIDKLREEIFLTIRGGYLPFMQGSSGGGDTRGSAQESGAHGTDPKERMLAKAIGRVLTHQLARPLTMANFGPRVGTPMIVLGGTDWGETKTQLEVADQVNKKVPISKKWYYKISQVPPPTSDEDTLPVDTGGGPGGGMPGMGGAMPGGGLGGPPGGPGPGGGDDPFAALFGGDSGGGGGGQQPPQPQPEQFSRDVFSPASGGPPGPPPWQGAIWNPNTHRWHNPPDPTDGTKSPHVAAQQQQPTSGQQPGGGGTSPQTANGATPGGNAPQVTGQQPSNPQQAKATAQSAAHQLMKSKAAGSAAVADAIKAITDPNADAAAVAKAIQGADKLTTLELRAVKQVVGWVGAMSSRQAMVDKVVDLLKQKAGGTATIPPATPAVPVSVQPAAPQQPAATSPTPTAADAAAKQGAPPGFKPVDAHYKFGDCEIVTYQQAKNALAGGVSNFIVKRGEVEVNGQRLDHTWIEVADPNAPPWKRNNRKVFDPTITQFNGAAVKYDTDNADTLSPKEFIDDMHSQYGAIDDSVIPKGTPLAAPANAGNTAGTPPATSVVKTLTPKEAESASFDSPKPHEAKTGSPWVGTVMRGRRLVQPGQQTDAGDYGKGTYWSGDGDRAAAYARPVIGTKGTEGHVLAEQVSLRNPLVFHTASDAAKYRNQFSGPNRNPQDQEAAIRTHIDLMKKGHDGVVVYDTAGDMTGRPDKPFEVVKLGDIDKNLLAKYPNLKQQYDQVKSAAGTQPPAPAQSPAPKPAPAQPPAQQTPQQQAAKSIIDASPRKAQIDSLTTRVNAAQTGNMTQAEASQWVKDFRDLYHNGGLSIHELRALKSLAGFKSSSSHRAHMANAVLQIFGDTPDLAVPVKGVGATATAPAVPTSQPAATTPAASNAVHADGNPINPKTPETTANKPVETGLGLKKIPLDSLHFPGGLSKEVTPLNDNSNQPILVEMVGNKYKLIDGFGRASGLQNAGNKYAHAIVVSKDDIAARTGEGDDPQWVGEMHHKYAPHSILAMSTQEWNDREERNRSALKHQPIAPPEPGDGKKLVLRMRELGIENDLPHSEREALYMRDDQSVMVKAKKMIEDRLRPRR